jgi:hypothetical protein
MMAWVNEQGYLERRKTGSKPNGRVRGGGRNWWFIKQTLPRGGMAMKLFFNIPERYYGKRIRFKIEVIEDGLDK